MSYSTIPGNLERLIELEYVIRCPACHNGPLEFGVSGARCGECQRHYVQQSGFLDFLPLDNINPSLSRNLLESTIYPSLLEGWARPALSRLTAGRSLQQSLELALDLMRLKRGQSVLDLVCGTGFFARQFASVLSTQGFVLGLDRSVPLLSLAESQREAARLDNLTFVRGDALHLPFMSDSFDRVHCAGAIQLMQDIPRAIAELHRVLREGGILVLSTYVNLDQPLMRVMRKVTFERAGVHWFPPIEIERLLTSSRFVIDWHSRSGYSLTVRAVAYK